MLAAPRLPAGPTGGRSARAVRSTRGSTDRPMRPRPARRSPARPTDGHPRGDEKVPACARRPRRYRRRRFEPTDAVLSDGTYAAELTGRGCRSCSSARSPGARTPHGAWRADRSGPPPRRYRSRARSPCGPARCASPTTSTPCRHPSGSTVPRSNSPEQTAVAARRSTNCRPAAVLANSPQWARTGQKSQGFRGIGTMDIRVGRSPGRPEEAGGGVGAGNSPTCIRPGVLTSSSSVSRTGWFRGPCLLQPGGGSSASTPPAPCPPPVVPSSMDHELPHHRRWPSSRNPSRRCPDDPEAGPRNELPSAAARLGGTDLAEAHHPQRTAPTTTDQ
ncbi:hypothetical protein ACVWXB_000341 [Streptomyces sp. TE12347]